MMEKIVIIRKAMDGFNGGERVCANLCNSLSTHFDVTLINHYKNDSVYKLVKSVKLRFLHSKKGRLRKSLRNDILTLRKFIIKNSIGLIIVTDRLSLIIVTLACFLTNCRFFFLEQTSLLAQDVNNGLIKAKAYKILNQFLITQGASKIITLTSKERENYIRKYHINPKRIVSIYNFLDPVLQYYEPQYDKNSKKIISVGRITPIKGYEYLIEVAKKIFVKYPSWQWDIYGQPEEKYYKFLLNKLKDNHLEKFVHFYPATPDIYKKYGEYALLVFTSIHEGFGMVLLEAKACGLPLVSFDIFSGPSDIITNKYDGFLIPPYDTDFMAEVILKLIQNENLRFTMANHARENIDKFFRENIIKKWENLINGFLKDGL